MPFGPRISDKNATTLVTFRPKSGIFLDKKHFQKVKRVALLFRKTNALFDPKIFDQNSKPIALLFCQKNGIFCPKDFRPK